MAMPGDASGATREALARPYLGPAGRQDEAIVGSSESVDLAPPPGSLHLVISIRPIRKPSVAYFRYLLIMYTVVADVRGVFVRLCVCAWRRGGPLGG
jgi:hypothetical protein